jgi:hypothetical protein
MTVECFVPHHTFAQTLVLDMMILGLKVTPLSLVFVAVSVSRCLSHWQPCDVLFLKLESPHGLFCQLHHALKLTCLTPLTGLPLKSRIHWTYADDAAQGACRPR